MPAFVKLRPYLFERCPHALANGYTPNYEHTALGLITEMGEPEKIERFGFTFSALLTIFDREPAKPQQACFLWMQGQVELGESNFQRMAKTPCIFMFSNPSTLSSAYRTAIISPFAVRPRHCLTHKSIT